MLVSSLVTAAGCGQEFSARTETVDESIVVKYEHRFNAYLSRCSRVVNFKGGCMTVKDYLGARERRVLKLPKS